MIISPGGGGVGGRRYLKLVAITYKKIAKVSIIELKAHLKANSCT